MKYLGVTSALVVAGALVSNGAHASEDNGVDLGLRLGYGLPLGSLAESANMSDLVSGQVPIWVDAGYRFTPNVLAGLYFQYGFGFVPDSGCAGGISGISCSASDIRFGVQGQYRFMPLESVDPWAGIGFGYEWLDFSASGGGLSQSAGVHGWEFLHLQGGVDFKVAESVGVGPFLDFSLGEYESGSFDLAGLGSGGGDIQRKALHEWLTLGVRVVFDP